MMSNYFFISILESHAALKVFLLYVTLILTAIFAFKVVKSLIQGPPELSKTDLNCEQRKQKIALALKQARSRLDTVHGLVRAKKTQDAMLIARTLLVDLANLQTLLGKGNPVETPESAINVLLDSQFANESIRAQLSDHVQGDERTTEPSIDLIDALFWELHKLAHRTMTTDLLTPLDRHEVKNRRQVAIALGLLWGALLIFIAVRQSAKTMRYNNRLDSLYAVANINHKGNYLRQWLLTDPIDAPHGFGRNIDVDFMETAGGEPSILPTPGTTSLLIDDTKAIWNPIVSSTNHIDLTGILGHHDDSVTYAFTTLRSSRLQTATLFLGSDDGIKVWLNGKVVFSTNRMRILNLDENQIEVTLREGVNSLLLKITQDKGPWSFACRVATHTETRTSK